MAVYLDSELREQLAGNSADSDSTRCLPGAGPLQNRADIIETVLDGPCQVSVARAELCQGLDLLLHR